MALDTILIAVSLNLGSSHACLEAELRGLTDAGSGGSDGTEGVLHRGREGQAAVSIKALRVFLKCTAAAIGSCSQARGALSDNVWEEGSSETRWDLLRWKDKRDPFKLSFDFHLGCDLHSSIHIG